MVCSSASDRAERLTGRASPARACTWRAAGRATAGRAPSRSSFLPPGCLGTPAALPTAPSPIASASSALSDLDEPFGSSESSDGGACLTTVPDASKSMTRSHEESQCVWCVTRTTVAPSSAKRPRTQCVIRWPATCASTADSTSSTRTRERHARLLPTGEVDPALANLRLISGRKLREIVRERACLHDERVAFGVEGRAEKHVVAQREVLDPRLLRAVGDRAAQADSAAQPRDLVNQRGEERRLA
eukprot:91815-Pleurochrysis_carterae.AAC.1